MKQGKSGRIGLGTVAALLLMSVSLVLFPLSENAHATPTIPSGVQAYVPITLTNSQSSATGSGFQQKLTISWNSYASYLNSGVTNAEFFDGAGNVLKGWCESACSSAAASSIVWVNLGSDVIPASGGILTIYLGFLTTGTNNMGNSGSSVWGEAPQLSSTYGQYDDGANVFQFYDNFAGSALSSAWNTAGASGTFSVSNGLVMDSYQFPGYSLSLNNQYTGPLVLDAYQVSTSGAWLGATFSNLQTTTSSYGITGGAAQEIYPPQGADGLNGVCISSGCTTLVPSPVTTTLQVVTLAVGASSATGYQNYANAVTVSGTISLTNYPGLFQVAWNPTDAQTTTWFRIRAYPPSNTMPTASVGALVGVVTQPITLTIAESGAPSSGSFTVSGCDAQVTTIGASTSGTTTDVVAQTSCSITITAPPPSGNSRYVFAGGAASETFSTCSTGTCPAQPYTVYYQLSNAYQVTAKAQPAFDSGMSWPVTGTIAGSAAQTGCTISSTPSASDSCSAYFDYNLTVTIPQAASSPPANSRWQSSAACPFTTTSGGSTDNCNSFKQWTDRSLYSVTGGGTPSPPELACIEYGNPASSNLTGSFQTYWCDNGGSWSVTNPLAPSGASERWVTSNSTSGVVNSAQTLGFVYHHQYYLTVASAHDTPTGQGWYGAGQAASFAITNATVGGGPGVRHVFAGWSSNDTGGYTGSMASASATMDGPIAETAGWLTEYNVTYASSGCAIPVTLPANEWVVSGGGASGSFSATVNGPPGTRCVFIGDDRPGAITSPTTVTGTYQTQYYLTVVSTHDTPTGQGWYNSSASATFGVTTPVNGSAGTRFVFYGWSSNDTGGYTGSSQSASVTVNNPITETEAWTTQYLVRYSQSGCVLSVSLPAAEWVASGGAATGVFPASVTSLGTRCLFMSDDRPGAVTAPTLVTGTYQTQYYLTLASAFDTPTGQGWYNAGTPATFRITSTTVSGPTGERFVFSGWTSSDPHGYTGGAANNTATMDNPISENATWTTQYYLTVSSPHGTTSGGGWYDAGSRANFSVAPHTVLGNATTRYVFVGWNTGDNGTVVMNGPVNETAVWSTEYLVNLYQSGSGVAPSVNYTVNGVPGTALVPSSVWALNGSELEFAYQGVVPGSSGMRYVLTGADHTSPLTMGGPLNITAHYKTQFLVKFVASGCAISVVPPANEWVDSGRPATGVFDPTVASGLTRCLFTGDNRPSNITVQTTVTGSYQTQYYLAIISAHDTPTGQGWYNASATASFGVTTPADQSAGTRYVLSAWSSGNPGGYSGANPSASVTVDNPINETASWVTEYYLNVTSAHGTTSGAGWYDAGVNALFGVSPTTVNGSPGVRYVLQGWLPGGMGNVTMLGPVNEVAQWATQYYVQYAQTGCTLAVTVPAGWVDSGGAALGSFPSPVSGIATQCLFLGDDRPVTVEAPTTVNGTYKTQFTLALSTPYGTALGGGWYDKGSNASFDVSPTTVGTFVFTAWEGSPGGYTGPDHSASAIMDAPINETAEWTAMSTTTTSTSTSSLTSTNSTTTITTTLSSNTTTAASTTSTSTTTVTATNSSTASSTSSTTTVTTTVTATNSTTSTGSSSTTTVTSTISPTTSSSTTTITTTTTTIVVVPSTTVVNCVPSSAVVGSRIKCDATVTGSSPTGVVTWSASGSGRFSGPTCRISNGTCGVTFTPTAGGASVTITGSYGGNVHNSPSSGRFILRVTAKASRTAVSCKPASTLAGSSQVIRCTAVVKGYFPTGTVAWSQVGGTGSVSFTTDVCNLGQGRCFVTMRAVNAGSVTILGRYTGDGNNQGSSMNGVLVIHPVKPRLAVSCTSSSMNVGSEVTCTATLAGYTGSVTGEEVIWAQVSGPGRVSFSRVECALSAAGSCSMSVKGLSPGGLQFKAFYVGDQNNLRSAVAHNLTVKRA